MSPTRREVLAQLAALVVLPLPARARIEQLIEWALPVAEELGVAGYLAVPAQNAAERQLARYAEGASLEQIYAEELGDRVG